MPLQPVRFFRIALAISLAGSALLYFLWSWQWPLVGDASLIHYIAFLTERGWAPYRQLGDMNMPGSFLIEMAAMRIFGMGDLAWRLFDFTLVAVAAGAFFVIAGAKNRLAGLFAASLFLLVHGRDGLAQGGQRDLTMAVCLIAATASLLTAMRAGARVRSSAISWPAALFGLLSGIAITIKPTAVLLTVAQAALLLHTLRRQALDDPNGQANGSRIGTIVPAILGWLIAPIVAFCFLVRERALTAFIDGFHGIVPYYASLGHRSLGYILLHSLSPLLSLVILWLALLACDRTLLRRTLNWSQDRERAALSLGILFGLINCIVQARALPYYRYPLLAFLLPVMALDFTQTFQRSAGTRANGLRVRAAGALAFLGLFVGGLVLAPQSAVLIHRYRWWQMDFIDSLEQNLNTLGGSRLSGHVQCIDSVSGCGTVLFRMRLEPSTGVLSDFLLFGPSDMPIIQQTRQQLSAAMRESPPQVIVVTAHLHMDGPDNYLKLSRWPEFTRFLDDRYTLQSQWVPPRAIRWWSREEKPDSYRIYVLRQP
ncbi:MAG TPA: hypothetical protein VGN01_18280 [Acidobacteriaceae bacterium]|jgi:hypothetical protein